MRRVALITKDEAKNTSLELTTIPALNTKHGIYSSNQSQPIA